MKKVYGLENWVLDSNVKNDKRLVNLKIMLSYPYPDQRVLIDLTPKERLKKIDEGFKTAFKKLSDLNWFEYDELIGTKKRPTGLKTKVKYTALSKLDKLDLVRSIWIESVEHATKIEAESKIQDKFFCVKMTVVIEIEGLSRKKQEIEKRLVLIKARSAEDAYQKLRDQKDEYAKPYLNPGGRFVRWRIDSFDDCFETDMNSIEEMNDAAGVEVYSKLKSRKNEEKAIWDGKF
ncbi:DUF4288 domain-containing protein [Mucilaginibacter sp. HC2]|uniref:DUF4288 domain-containing protein n=1 Tax=Mucilaginibacter inviolabilis TaxID=2714892 RepID=UPI001407FF4A|nr:DUF4288 domain-containing protein [Mucilaginibacter inviolabilis]NHA07102.1 DUF4288 domain-containing protein [Mucilaginibacter inviolabilis]